MTIRNAALMLASAGLSLLACDPSVFEYRIARPGELDAAVADGGGVASASQNQDSQARGETQSAQSVVDASIHRAANGAPAPDAGMLTFGAVGSAGSAVDAGAADASSARSPIADHDAHAGMERNDSMDAGSAQQPPAANGVNCPQLPTEADESFCYDFEAGLNGPRAGDVYDLWTSPQLPAANQLLLAADPDHPQNHVLQTKPSLTASEASAALSHSTHSFERATVEFDLWVNQTLLQASADVSCFRYVPMDGDEDHVVALIFRRGRVLLRAENLEEQSLSMLPRRDGKPTHVSVELDRRGPCRTNIQLDGITVASQSQDTCAPDKTGFVEFGLVMQDRQGAELSAYYDNLAFRRR